MNRGVLCVVDQERWLFILVKAGALHPMYDDVVLLVRRILMSTMVALMSKGTDQGFSGRVRELLS